MENYFENKNKEIGCIDGFVCTSSKSNDFASDYFPVKREIRIRTFQYNGFVYFRIRDIAMLLGLKQPFQFAADLKAFCTAGGILKGEETIPFREKTDSNTVPFVEANALLSYLLQDKEKYGQKYDKEIYVNIVNTLQQREQKNK